MGAARGTLSRLITLRFKMALKICLYLEGIKWDSQALIRLKKTLLTAESRAINQRTWQEKMQGLSKSSSSLKNRQKSPRLQNFHSKEKCTKTLILSPRKSLCTFLKALEPPS